MANRIESTPTDGLTYNLNEPKYFDRKGLDKELERVFKILMSFSSFKTSHFPLLMNFDC